MKKVTVTLLACLMVLLAGSAVKAQDAGDDQVVIKRIEIQGNFEVSDDKILSVIESKVGEVISPQKLEDDLQRIYDLGYFSEDAKAKLSEYEDGAKITFRVVENPVLQKITIKGNTALTDQEIREVMESKENQILNRNLLESDFKAIETLFKEKGYIMARVVNLNVTDKNDLEISVTEGTIKEIDVVYIVRDEETDEIIDQTEFGKTKKKVITREMKTKEGDVFNAEKVRRDLQKVFNLGLFNDVSWEYDTDPTRVGIGEIILQVLVEEAKTGQVGFGAGYSSNSGLTGFLSYSERNLKGMGRRVTSNVEFGGKGDDYELGYFEPWADKKNTSMEVNFYSRSTENLRYGLGGIAITDYEEVRKGLNFSLGRPLSDFTRAYVGFTAEDVDIDPQQYDYLDGALRSVALSLRTDTRDNIFDPTTGRMDTGTVEFYGDFLGGDYQYQKFNLDLRRFFPVRDKQVFGAHMFIGLGKEDVPRFDYYDIGGVNTVRGYEEFEYAGSKAVYMNLEYRFSLAGNVSAVLFSDFGGVWNDFSDISFEPDDYVKSVGLGLRLKVPYFGGLGPIRLDYAYALSKEESKIHFGFGHMF